MQILPSLTIVRFQAKINEIGEKSSEIGEKISQCGLQGEISGWGWWGEGKLGGIKIGG